MFLSVKVLLFWGAFSEKEILSYISFYQFVIEVFEALKGICQSPSVFKAAHLGSYLLS